MKTVKRLGADIPRRACVDLNTPLELAVREVRCQIENAGAHPLLTDASVLVGQALDKIADYVELEVKNESK